jgi:isopentenyl diphosphate isomerase/L-lactate dehydrogenase-like FMN-dependent dehydrogenase
MIGIDVTMPVALAPTGLTGMQHADGEILAARAAEQFGIPFTLSTMSICSIEDVAAHTKAPFWFQLYVMRDRDFIERLIDRAKAANCGALMLTLDLQILGQRHKDIKNGLSAPPKPTLANMLNLMTKPRWCLGMLGTRQGLELLRLQDRHGKLVWGRETDCHGQAICPASGIERQVDSGPRGHGIRQPGGSEPSAQFRRASAVHDQGY